MQSACKIVRAHQSFNDLSAHLFHLVRRGADIATTESWTQFNEWMIKYCTVLGLGLGLMERKKKTSYCP